MKTKDEMFKLGSDQKHLQDESYKTAEKLDIRILTHQKYTQPQVDFYDWVLDQIKWTGQEIAFDIGCGSARYGSRVSQRSKGYFACDLSHGMLKEGAGAKFQCVNLDAMMIPLAENSADVILANHMIYHIPDQKRGIAEFRRVLKPNGKLIAATNSSENMKELQALRLKAFKLIGLEVDADMDTDMLISLAFHIESGANVLKSAFDHVQTRILENWLVIPEPQPIIDYISSSRDWYEGLFPEGFAWDDYVSALRQILDNHFESQSEFRISKKTGAFVCW